MKFSCVVIDDEKDAVEEITEYIDNTERINILATFNSSMDALRYIKENGPVEIVFMDVDMPVLNGVELSTMIRPYVKKLIFTTSHAKYAVDAFEIEAEGFLLKPFNFAKLLKLVDRLFPEYARIEIERTPNNYIFVKSKEDDLKLIRINISDIIAVESQLNYIKIYTSNGNVVTHMSLKEAKELLLGYPVIIQLHRSFLISTNHIHSIEGNRLVMANNIRFSIGDNFKDVLNNYLNNKIFRPPLKK
ncbi:LytR/AlgR family response regulator transcription factor [Pedobacter agri]|uniref:LytTR family DNA-binding domain-containing protein n=1 Tax=Pedobacter agri TaxID=454586 RepID=A0A9X3DBZ4_9SPHI|nr:LytTR family DNA-binding domain-containing protein [Pedobacter agri]MCX3264908.1 LytTR family DNA-binding domain-containing protein [Pedobacter agri]